MRGESSKVRQGDLSAGSSTQPGKNPDEIDVSGSEKMLQMDLSLSTVVTVAQAKGACCL
jgi:hypothetical protein